MEAGIVKTCGSCGRDHTEETWSLLHLLGVNELGEWRDCECGSTLLRPERAVQP